MKLSASEAAQRVKGLTGWTLEGDAIKKQFTFKDFLEAVAFVNRLAPEAERAYHRTIAGSAFLSPSEGPSAVEIQRESLEALEAARVRLDEVRARKPE